MKLKKFFKSEEIIKILKRSKGDHRSIVYIKTRTEKIIVITRKELIA